MRWLGGQREWKGNELLPKLLAKIAFLFSIQQSQLIADNGEIMKKDSSDREIKAVRPHCIQIIGIFYLFNLAHEGKVVNQLGEILPGQGKSWALLLMASVTMLTGNNVKILCHNKDLAVRGGRNAARFLKLLEDYKPKEKADQRTWVQYQTFEDLGWEGYEYMDESRDPPERVEMHDAVLRLLNNDSSLKLKPKSTSANTILLIDEVDILFSDLYGQVARMVTIDTEEKKGEVQIENSPQSEQRRGLWMQLAEKAEGDGGEHTATSKEKQDDRAAINLAKDTLRKALHVVPSSFGAILGVTGSLHTLTKQQKDTLEECNISEEQLIYCPSLWGDRNLNLTFSLHTKWKPDVLDKDSFNVFQEEDDWAAEVLRQIKYMHQQGRAVLVFTRNSEQLALVMNKVAAALNPDFIHKLDPLDPKLEHLSSEEKRRVVEDIIQKKAGQDKMVTFATATFGRGDFKYSSPVLERGGGHCIQLFLSTNKAEEVQIRGRIARKNEKGSYSLFLTHEDIEATINHPLDFEQFQNFHAGYVRDNKAAQGTADLYREVDRLRTAACDRQFHQQRVDAKLAEQLHQDTHAFFQELPGIAKMPDFTPRMVELNKKLHPLANMQESWQTK